MPSKSVDVLVAEARRWTINPCRDCGNHQTAFALCGHQADDEGDDWREQSPDTVVVAVDDVRTAIGALREEVESRVADYGDHIGFRRFAEGRLAALDDLAKRLGLNTDEGRTGQ